MKEPRICPSCGKAALPVATRCPGCGCAFELRYDRPAFEASSSRKGLVTAGTLAVVAILVANGVREWGARDHSATQTAAMDIPPAGSTPAPRDPSPAPAERRPVAPVATTKGPAAVPAASKAAMAKTTPAPRQAVIPAPEPAHAYRDTSSGEARYASTWINVRSARNSQAPVVRVLKPGEAVQVDSLAEGWYQVVTTDAVQGYADRRLLKDEAPVNR